MSGLRDNGSAPWQDGAGTTVPVPAAADVPAAPLRERIMAGLSTIGDLARVALSVITSLAALMFLVLVVVEWRTVRTLVEPLQVPDTLVDKGLTAEVMSSTLLDRISTVTASDRDRWRPASIAPGWGTTDLNIPLLDISVASLAGLAKTLWGPPDLRVTGEVVAAPGAADTYTVRLRLKDPTNGWVVLKPTHQSVWNSTTDPVEALFDPVIHDLLLHTDPLSLANHSYVTEVEQYRARAAEHRLSPDLCELHQRGEIVEAIGRCIRGCGVEDKALAYIVWGDLLMQASDLRGDDAALLEDAIDKYAAAIAIADETGIAYTHWGQALDKLGRVQEGATKFAEAVAEHDDDFLAQYDLAERLMMGLPANPAEAAAAPDLARAIDHYGRSARLQPDNDWTLTRWGQALLRRQDLARAAEKFREAIRLSGSNVAAREGLCEAEVPDPGARHDHPSCRRAASLALVQSSRATSSAAGTDPPCASITTSSTPR